MRQKPVMIEEVQKASKDGHQADNLAEEDESDIAKLRCENECLKAELAKEKLEKQCTHELSSPGASLEKIPKSLLGTSGLDVHLKLRTMLNVLKFDSSSRAKCKYVTHTMDTTVNPFDLMPYQVHAKTAFHDIRMLLTFVLTVCNGDVDTMTHCISKLGWFEECFYTLNLSMVRLFQQ
jgi:hypothetical protein